jgi:hypothetical protein
MKKPYQWKTLIAPTREIAELMAAATEAEQKELSATVDRAMERAIAQREMLLSGCKFRGFVFILVADPKDGPALIDFEKFANLVNKTSQTEKDIRARENKK